jgi:hypothetical protein
LKRYNVIKHFMGMLSELDVAIFSGPELCKEAHAYNREGNFYIDDTFGMAVSFALGIAMCSDKRIFVFVGEGDLLRDLSSATQAAVSRCKKLIMVVLDNDSYYSSGNQPSIFNRVTSKRGLFYDMGFLVQDYSVHFNKLRLKQLQAAVSNLPGPTYLLVELSKGNNKKLAPINIDRHKSKLDLEEFLRREPQADSTEDAMVLNLDEVGGND